MKVKQAAKQGDENLSRIKAVTKDKKLIITSRPIITSGSKNIDEIMVVFDKTWKFDCAEYFISFYTDADKDGEIRSLDISGKVGRCRIPEFITENDGFFHFGVFAETDYGIVKTSEIVAYEVRKGIMTSLNTGNSANFKTPKISVVYKSVGA